MRLKNFIETLDIGSLSFGQSAVAKDANKAASPFLALLFGPGSSSGASPRCGAILLGRLFRFDCYAKYAISYVAEQ